MGRRGAAINQHTGTGGMIMDDSRERHLLESTAILVGLEKSPNQYPEGLCWGMVWEAMAVERISSVRSHNRLRDAYRSALEVIRRQAEVIKGLRALVDMQKKIGEIHKMAAILNPYSVTCAHVTESYFYVEPRKPKLNDIGQEF
jgi:hypothetical protein